jgi:hypothetical protein
MKTLIVSFILILVLSSCATVKPYDRQYISDPEMQMSADAGSQYNNYVHSIRTGATKAEGTKTSGGCGCN